MTVALFVLAAGAGAGGRFLLYRLEHSWQAVLVANTVGSLVVGIVFAADLGSEAEVLLAVGLCGALTTYSAFADELHRLGPRLGTVYALVTAVLCIGVIAVTAAVI